ncbi:MAG: sialate O-acetylesterase [Lachnospiraceae bacterium]|nr:sialate O-acetylesterase [Lachnospiraceae bacterium]
MKIAELIKKSIFVTVGILFWGSLFNSLEVSATVQLPKVNTTPLTQQIPIVNAADKTQAPVTVDVIIFAGQSNMSGNGGNALLSPVVPPGQGYEYRPATAPNSLFPVIEPFGRYEGGYISDVPSYQNGTLVSSFMNAYFAKTGVPVVGVPATHGGTDSSYWVSDATKADLLSRFIKTKAYLASNNFTVRRKFLVFLQGESDAVKGISQTEYKNNLISAFQPLFANGLEQVFIITPGYAVDGIYSYDDVVNAQKDLCNSNNLFTLASDMLHSPAMNAYLNDAVHYNQAGLNLVGANAGTNAAAFANGGF